MEKTPNSVPSRVDYYDSLQWAVSRRWEINPYWKTLYDTQSVYDDQVRAIHKEDEHDASPEGLSLPTILQMG